MIKTHLLISFVLLFFVPSECCFAADKESKRPNVVLVMVDDFGYECVGAYGGTSYKTPNIDRMAAQGMRFDYCYSQPICTPSRVKLMTGIYNVRNYRKFGLLPPKETTFAQLFQGAGYKTCVVGKWQLQGGMEGPKHFGFDEYCLWQLTRRPSRYPNPGLEINGKTFDYSSGEYGPDVCADFACEFIKKNKAKPFLLYYPMILTHCPFEPAPDSPDWDPESKGSPTYKGDAKYFGSMVYHMDKVMAKLEATLKEAGVLENTLILFTGDNGTDEPVVSMMKDRGKVAGGKGKMTDAGTHAPLIAYWPGKIVAGQVSKELVDFSDFLPTICECAGIEVPSKLNIDGRSFMPQLSGEKGNPRQWAYCWYARNGGAKGKVWARTQRYKLYGDGKLFDIHHDVLEKSPLDPGTLDDKQKQVRQLLQSALDKYANSRSAEVAQSNQKKEKKPKEKKKKNQTIKGKSPAETQENE